MSTKRFMVIDTRTMQKKSFESQATTVSELKADLRNLGIDTEGMTIQEGLTKTELKSDLTPLPHDVPYKGGTTNNLVFRLTQSEKRIKSGASMSRQEAYAKVKELGLTAVITKKYGKNFTMCKTADLIAEIESVLNKEVTSEKEDRATNISTKTSNINGNKITQAVTLLTRKLVIDNVISFADGIEIMNILDTTWAEESAYSSEEIDDMFKDM